ncbi:hypothetical protein [Mycobacterium sp. ACS4331]|uniref:hypothetical protein n=1 Tax=Mycobacterium sp. ACS4331 TaxID=1834121 RepID=UPI000836B04F|nr:hypothetical protein [Mycobacterium sp. ACS4331]
MENERQQTWLKIVSERTNDSARHKAAAEAILQNTPVAAEHVEAAEELVRLKLAFPRSDDGTYAANLYPDFR